MTFPSIICYKTLFLQHIILLCAIDFIYYVLPTFPFQLDIISFVKIATCTFFSFVLCLIINFTRPVSIMGKNFQKLCHTPKSIPPGKGGKPYGKSPKVLCLKWYGLTVYIIRFYKFYGQNFQFFKIVPSQSPRTTQILHSSPTQSANYAKFAHFVNLFYIMFQAPAPAENPAKFQRITQIPRSSPTQPANYAKLAPFVNIIHYVSDT